MRNQLKIHTYLLYQLYVGMYVHIPRHNEGHPHQYVAVLRWNCPLCACDSVNMDVNKLDQMGCIIVDLCGSATFGKCVVT